MTRREDLFNKIDWTTVLIYLVLVLMGWLNIYAAVYDESATGVFNLSNNAGKQFLWILTSLVLIVVIMSLDYKTFDSLSYVIYGVVMLLLILVVIFGREVSGAKSWFQLGGLRIQPSEFAKFATALALAKFLGQPTVKFSQTKNQIISGLLIGLPVVLILLQPDTGTAMVFGAFVIVLYREGLSPNIIIIGLIAIALFILTLLVQQIYLIIGIVITSLIVIGLGKKATKQIVYTVIGTLFIIGVVRSVDYFITDVLKPHQQNRIKALINPSADPLGYGFHVTQSKIAIGSGGLVGKGFLNGTQTKFDFVPEQSTDFIFCTLGEEHGWIGSLLMIILFIALLMRIVYISERQKWRFIRIYGYSVASILFLHFLINIGMTIGLFPVIGIPLPFFSYGGSSLWSFTILLFILLKFDSHRNQLLFR